MRTRSASSTATLTARAGVPFHQPAEPAGIAASVTGARLAGQQALGTDDQDQDDDEGRKDVLPAGGEEKIA